MKVITVTNRKGGIGKSTHAGHIAAALAILGYRVGMVDAGPQGHLSALFGRPALEGLFNVTVKNDPIERYASMLHPEEYAPSPKHVQGALYILPGSDMTSEITMHIRENTMGIMAGVVDDFDALYNLDFIIIDTQPTRTALDESTHMVTDGHLLVTELDLWSMEGLGKFMETLNQINATRQRFGIEPSKIIGIIPNKVNMNTILHQENLQSLHNEYGDLVLPYVRSLIAWREATQVAQKPIYVYAPDSAAADDAWQVVFSIQERVQAWASVTR